MDDVFLLLCSVVVVFRDRPYKYRAGGESMPFCRGKIVSLCITCEKPAGRNIILMYFDMNLTKLPLKLHIRYVHRTYLLETQPALSLGLRTLHRALTTVPPWHPRKRKHP